MHVLAADSYRRVTGHTHNINMTECHEATRAKVAPPYDCNILDKYCQLNSTKKHDSLSGMIIAMQEPYHDKLSSPSVAEKRHSSNHTTSRQVLSSKIVKNT